MRPVLLSLLFFFGCAESRLVRTAGPILIDRAKIEFQVVDERGNPVPGTVIKALVDNRVVASATTNKNGVANLELHPGVYTIHFNADAYNTLTKPNWQIVAGHWKFRQTIYWGVD